MRGAVVVASGGRGADLVFDTVGGAAVLSDALALGRPGSATVLFAHAASQGEAAGFDLNAFFKSERQLLATYSSGAAEQREIFDLLASGRLDPRPLVSHRLPLARAAEAVELATSHRALKVLLVADAEGVDGAGSVSGAGGVDDEGRDAR
jgi:L-iditol 2-dehydrogenase